MYTCISFSLTESATYLRSKYITVFMSTDFNIITDKLDIISKYDISISNYAFWNSVPTAYKFQNYNIFRRIVCN